MQRAAAMLFQCFFFQQGTVAEWLGRALQKLVQQFESARYLFSRFTH